MKLDNRSYIKMTPTDKRPDRRDLSFPELLGKVHQVPTLPQHNVKPLPKKIYVQMVEKEIADD
jgi:hypothetical protein